MMRAEPFEGNDDEAKSHFLASLRKILDTNKQISCHAIKMQNPEQITETMLNIRGLLLRKRKIIYKQQRIEDQHEWYRKKSTINKRLSFFWFVLLIVANSLAIIFAISKIIWPHYDYWPTDIFVTLSSVIMTWLQVKRYQELAASYALTTHEIGLLRAEFPDDHDEHRFSIFVSDAENAFSREHTQWQARRDTD